MDKAWKKPEVYQVVKKNKPPPVYTIDAIIAERGHHVLRLPPYHCDLNPIEMIWGQVKNKVASINNTFTLKSTLAFAEKCIGEVTAHAWKETVRHVVQIADKYRRSDGIQPLQNPVIVDLDDSSSSSEYTSDEN